MTKTKTHFFRYKKECHNCTRNAHLLIITERFGTVCRKCYKKEFNYHVELFTDLVDHCEYCTVIYTERELCDYLTDLDTVSTGLRPYGNRFITLIMARVKPNLKKSTKI